LNAKLSRNYFELKLFVIEQFINYKFSVLNTVRQLNKMQDEIKFNKVKIISFVLDYCKENTIVPSDYTPSKWEKVVKTYQPDMFQDFHESTKWESSSDFLNEMLGRDIGIKKEEIENLCGAVFKRSIASHLVSIDMVESSLLENERIYRKRLEFLESAKLFRLENDDYDEENLINFNITYEKEKFKHFEDFSRIKEKLHNILTKLNALSMNNLHAIGYTQDLQRTLLNQAKDNELNINIRRLDKKRDPDEC
jgi:hypothetical protein